MLQSIEADGSIIGHSEEDNIMEKLILTAIEKVKLALDKGLTPIYCNGETLNKESWSTP